MFIKSDFALKFDSLKFFTFTTTNGKISYFNISFLCSTNLRITLIDISFETFIRKTFE